MSSASSVVSLSLFIIEWINKTQSFVLLIFRLYMAKVFFMAGLTKIKSMDTTLMLFEYEYSVPLIPFHIAAYLATFAELVFPVLLALGLAGRFSALSLFILNLVAAISYPDISPGGLNDHYFWGSMLLVLVFWGPGKASVDTSLQAYLQQRFVNR